jgi:tRNA A37 threonylcarbamoyladenosine dehydratase
MRAGHVCEAVDAMLTDVLAQGESQAGADLQRCFGGIVRLYGKDALARFGGAHVCVIGVGGVGSWAAEALARSAIGNITLIDLDHVAESNVNRQVHALESEFGKAKVAAMAQRIRAINPACFVREVEEFVGEGNVESLLGRGYDFIIDAGDAVRSKAVIAAWCRRHKLRLITVGAAGGKTDPLRVEVADLSRTVHDPLLSKVRAMLRREYGFPRTEARRFGVPAVFSTEQPIRPAQQDTVCADTRRPLVRGGLNCAGYGSSMSVTAVFGLVAVSVVLKRLIGATEEKLSCVDDEIMTSD